jgi:hypothetical protein
MNIIERIKEIQANGEGIVYTDAGNGCAGPGMEGIMMTMENTSGYSQGELNALNEEFARRFSLGEWPTDNREEAEKWFSDEVCRRRDQQAA